ncbi:MAG: DUF4450 domain-containing protein [Muribaculum sp.]|nr:DUF4450 domain-containing protein [Muribaculum sp.]
MNTKIKSTLLALATLGLFFETEAAGLHYTPYGNSVISTNGTVKFNRGLYGAHTGFRVDCSDFPEFGIYMPNMGGNIRFNLPQGDCKAIYTPGRMDYDQGGVDLQVQVGRSDDMIIWRFTNSSKEKKEVSFRYGGASGKRFSREGDLGVDKPDCFDFKEENCNGNVYRKEKDRTIVEFGTKNHYTATLITGDANVKITNTPCLEGSFTLSPRQTKYIAFIPSDSKIAYKHLASLFDKAEKDRSELASSVMFEAPDEWLMPVGGALAIAGDAIWSGEAWLHGSIGWRTPHLGWRGAYTGDAIGRHDRAKTHFYNYAKNQIDSIPAIYQHPQQDTALNLARARKVWGTPMYSDGYICRRPGHKNEMSHYDMNLVYVDAMLRHFRHTGDKEAMRHLFPTLKRHLEWEKKNFDPDGDGLYDAYCCIWASDALYYNGGKVTHSSAYNAFANRLAAQVARQIGEDPTPFELEAAKITHSIDSALWLDDKGHWAEFQDVMGLARIHDKPAVWTIYHAVDSEITDPLKAYAATVYVDQNIPHIPVSVENGKQLYTISTTNWKPYSWSINNVAIAEVMHTALAYWQAGRPDEAYALMKGVAYDNMLGGASPLNFGQISRFDAARGECYRDFADPIGVWSRALTEGLYGIRPDLLSEKPHIDIIPGFPSDWNDASVKLPDLSYSFKRVGNKTYYNIENNYTGYPEVILQINGKGLKQATVNGKPVSWHPIGYSVGYPRVAIDVDFDKSNSAEIALEYGAESSEYPTGIVQKEGPVTFKEMTDGTLRWYAAEIDARQPHDIIAEGFDEVVSDHCRPIDISHIYNANVSDIFKNEYLSPRPMTTTLQIPKQGIGEWCHPTMTAEIDDSGLRRIVAENGGVFKTESGIPFSMNSDGKNIAYTSLWDNYPDSIQVKLDGKGSHAYLAMAGSTNHMQWGLPNGVVEIRYKDGSSENFILENPITWAPIEQDFYTDEYAFAQPDNAPLPLRFSLEDGTQSRRLGDVKNISGVEPRRIPGGAGILLDIPLDSSKDLDSLSVKTLSNDVVIGLMSVTLQN